MPMRLNNDDEGEGELSLRPLRSNCDGVTADQPNWSDRGPPRERRGGRCRLLSPEKS